jgi:transposase
MHRSRPELGPDDRDELEIILSRPTSPQRLVFRAQIVLLAADGLSLRHIARTLACSRTVVRKWVRRYCARGLAGLQDAARSGRPRRISAVERHSVVAAACACPEQFGLAAHTRWSGDLLAEVLTASGRVLSISARTVQRILHGASLKPHRVAYWKRKSDPNFEAKMRPIVDLYMQPPEDGPVWCFDEKTCIQALQRCFPNLPLRRPGELPRRSLEYVRHGTRCLLAALNVHTGQVIGQVREQRRRHEVVAFLDLLDAVVPADQVIHLVLDNLNVHRGPAIDDWAAAHPGRIQFHFLPFHASWLSQIEIWFSILERRCLRRGDFPTADVLERAIYAFIDTYNRRHAHPFRWTYTGDPLVA